MGWWNRDQTVWVCSHFWESVRMKSRISFIVHWFLMTQLRLPSPLWPDEHQQSSQPRDVALMWTMFDDLILQIPAWVSEVKWDDQNVYFCLCDQRRSRISRALRVCRVWSLRLDILWKRDPWARQKAHLLLVQIWPGALPLLQPSISIATLIWGLFLNQ